MHHPTLICFGEVLWDLLPAGKIAGGAPMNVACHANNLGVSTKMISRVGKDDLGQELLNFLQHKGVATQYIQLDENLPTGVVNVSLNTAGSPSYEIVQPVAWDQIQLENTLQEVVTTSDALVFGSLACRSECTRNTLFALLDKAVLRVFDVNLRSPFYTPELIETLLLKADIVKMNDDELDIITGWLGQTGNELGRMQFIKERFRLEMLILTKGDKGASCLDETGVYTHPGFSVQVKDTIGSGDAFLAAFLSKMLVGKSSQECLEFACALGALVATKQGGTPLVTNPEIQRLILKITPDEA